MKRADAPITRLVIPIVACLWFGSGIAEERGMKALSDFQWRNRLILVEDAGETEQRVGTLKQYAAGVDDRDIVWFVVGDHNIRSNLAAPGRDLEQDVRKTLKAQPDNVSVVLIGKDGGIKQRSRALDVGAIFALIDTMPMRRWEMR